MTPRPQRRDPNGDLPEGWRGQIVYPVDYVHPASELTDPDPFEFGEAMDQAYADDRRLWLEQHPEWGPPFDRVRVALVIAALASIPVLTAFFYS